MTTNKRSFWDQYTKAYQILSERQAKILPTSFFKSEIYSMENFRSEQTKYSIKKDIQESLDKTIKSIDSYRKPP